MVSASSIHRAPRGSQRGARGGHRGLRGPITVVAGAGGAHHIIAKEESGCFWVPLIPGYSGFGSSANLPRGTLQPLKRRPEKEYSASKKSDSTFPSRGVDICRRVALILDYFID